MRCFGSGRIWGLLGQFEVVSGLVWGLFWGIFGVFDVWGNFSLVLTLFGGILGQFWGVSYAGPPVPPLFALPVPPPGLFLGQFQGFSPSFFGAVRGRAVTGLPGLRFGANSSVFGASRR